MCLTSRRRGLAAQDTVVLALSRLVNVKPHAGLCRYQLADQYGHTQISTSNLAIVPQITYTSGQPSGQSSVVSVAEEPLSLSLHPKDVRCH